MVYTRKEIIAMLESFGFVKSQRSINSNHITMFRMNDDYDMIINHMRFYPSLTFYIFNDNITLEAVDGDYIAELKIENIISLNIETY